MGNGHHRLPLVKIQVLQGCMHKFDDEIFLGAYGNSKLSTLANFYGKKTEVTFEQVTYYFLAITNKELLGEWQVFKREENKAMMEKKHKPPSLQNIKDTIVTS